MKSEGYVPLVHAPLNSEQKEELRKQITERLHEAAKVFRYDVRPLTVEQRDALLRQLSGEDPDVRCND